ncbi:hypothetical protein CYMTET_36174, partial [Cymbomonas tetramitiformis]
MRSTCGAPAEHLRSTCGGRDGGAARLRALGPGRLHHCMRSVGMAERAMEMMCERMRTRKTFGKPIAQHGALAEKLAECRLAVEQARLLARLLARSLLPRGGAGLPR